MKERERVIGEEIPGTREIQHIITHEIHDDIESHIIKLKEALKEDKEFYDTLANHLVLVGKSIYPIEFNYLIGNYYWPAIENSENRTEKKAIYSVQANLKEITNHIFLLLDGNEDIKQKIAQLPQEDQNEVRYITREEIREEIHKIVKSLDYCDV